MKLLYLPITGIKREWTLFTGKNGVYPGVKTTISPTLINWLKDKNITRYWIYKQRIFFLKNNDAALFKLTWF